MCLYSGDYVNYHVMSDMLSPPRHLADYQLRMSPDNGAEIHTYQFAQVMLN